MNIEEKEKLKEEVKNVAYNTGTFFNIYEVSLSEVLKIIDKFELDQPKLKIPQFILDWVDDSREHGYEFDEWFYYSNQPLEVYEWLNPENKRQAELNALALVTLIVNGPDAVTVEKEKLYTVEIPNPNIIGNSHTVLMRNGFKQIVMLRVFGDNWKTNITYQLTEQEIRKDFEWALKWKKEVI